jgi:hypothetical protein
MTCEILPFANCLTYPIQCGIIVIRHQLSFLAMRTIIDIPTERLQQLDEFCGREELSRSEAVRRAIALFLEEHIHQDDNAFGLWKGRGTDGVTYQRALRDEWDQ